jgi:glycine cleavage system transcriptional repressor
LNDQYLAETAVGADRPGIVAALTALLAQRGANVADSRMAVLGGEFALLMLVSAQTGGLDALRSELERAGQSLGLQLLIRETGSPAAHRAGRVRSYEVQVHALDHPGIVHAVAQAIRDLGGNVVSLETSAYQAAITGAPLFEMSVSADFPADISVTRLRETLEAVSEAANADIEVSPA